MKKLCSPADIALDREIAVVQARQRRWRDLIQAHPHALLLGQLMPADFLARIVPRTAAPQSKLKGKTA